MTVQDIRDSLDCAMDGGAFQYGDVDLERIAIAGHSYGGSEAVSTACHDKKFKRTLMFNIAIFQENRRYLF